MCRPIGGAYPRLRRLPVWDAIGDDTLGRLACDAYCQSVYLRDGEPVFVDTKYRSPGGTVLHIRSTLNERLAAMLPGHDLVDEPYLLLEEEGHLFSHPPDRIVVPPEEDREHGEEVRRVRTSRPNGPCRPARAVEVLSRCGTGRSRRLVSPRGRTRNGGRGRPGTARCGGSRPTR